MNKKEDIRVQSAGEMHIYDESFKNKVTSQQPVMPKAIVILGTYNYAVCINDDDVECVLSAIGNYPCVIMILGRNNKIAMDFDEYKQIVEENKMLEACKIIEQNFGIPKDIAISDKLYEWLKKNKDKVTKWLKDKGK
jgi:hypothetical protein